MAKPVGGKKRAGKKAVADARNDGGAAARKPVTIRDVALVAGVSPMTVSNVVNGKQFVGKEMQRRVARAIKEMNYRVLTVGRSLKLGRRHSLGVIIIDEMPDFMSHPFISRFVSGFSGHLNRNDYTMIVQGIHPDVFAQAVLMKRAEADAYCVRLNGRDEARREMLEILSRISEPVVLIQESLPVHDANRCVVRQDDHGGGLMLADHFAARGVRRLVVASPRFSGPMTEARLKGLDDGFRAAQANPDVETLQCPINSFASAYETIGQRLDAKPPPQAILGTNDDIAYAAMRALQDRGIRVPDDVLVAGFNGFQPQAYTNPSLTTVVSQAVEIGATAGQCLLERLATGRFPRSQIVLPVSFRRGGST